MTQPFAATYRLHTALPDRLFCGEPLLLDVELLNTGHAPWLTVGAFPVRLGYRWVGPGGGVTDGGRAPLPAPVPPGMGARIELRVESPPAPGGYRLQVELVEEGRAWFSQRGLAPLTIEVAYAPAEAPRVAIINGNVVANDAVGGHIVSQLYALRAAGYHTMVITEFVDSRLSADARRSMMVANADELRDLHSGNLASHHLRQADIVIVNYSTYYALAEMIREVRRGVVIFDYHGVTPPELWGKEWPGYEDLVRGRDNLGLVRYADYGIGHSRFTCDELVSTGQIAPGRVSLMPYAVVERSGYAGPPDPAVVERFGLAGRHVLLYVGRMARNKRVIDLVEAMPAILAQHPAACLLLVGEDRTPAYREYADEVRARADELGVTERVIFTGQVDDATLESCYRACAAFVTASIHEGFCMPVVEAMSRGRPVVSADATATPGTLGGAGLLFRPQDPAGLADQVCALLDGLPAPGDHSDPLAIHQTPPADADEIAAMRVRPIAIVTPRYGPQILGGAETGMRSWAEQLAARGYRVDVLTTGTVDMADWSDHIPPGVEELNGVTVRRFHTSKVDVGIFHGLMQRANRGERLRYHEERRFMANNLRSADLERYVAERADDYACLIYAPYLFGTTYWPASAAPERSIIVPCLHDEPSAHLAMFRELLERSAALFFNADAEGTLASVGMGVANPYRASLGFGFADHAPSGDAARFRERTGIAGPMLLYSGRLEAAKNVPLLIEWFTRYKSERPGPLALALTGGGSAALPERPDVLALGMLSREELTDAYAVCTAICQPSLNESFSIVIMEAWLQGRPAIVHAGCAVTSEHVGQSGGGYAPGSYEQFRDALDALLADPAHADDLGARGRAYVQERYSWGRLLPRIEAAIAAFSRPRPLYARLAQRGVARALDFTRSRFDDALLELVSRAEADLPASLAVARRGNLHRAAEIARPGYAVRSDIPLIGPAVAWLRRQLTSHIKEPYLDPMIAEQDRFNRDLLDTLLPALDESLREQRRLRAEIDLLRERIPRHDAENGS
ncbi:glycosyltransferase family 4 protein [Chloroflexales bacterium ZM16-3]|nr:glycosyltransferase family 4 protein [Chloroflexales bacterium ZM16-3]